MSNQLLQEVRKLPVKGPAKAVLMTLADHADENWRCWPSHLTIATESGVCKATVKNALRKLKCDGLLTWETTITEKGDPGSNSYRLTLGGGVRDTPPRAGDAPPVGQEIPQGGAGDSYKAPMEAPKEAKERSSSISKKSKSEISLVMPFPSEVFAEVWREWEQHRIEIKHKITPTSAKGQFKKLLAMGEARSITAIQHSIANGWRGIFEPPANGSHPQPQPAPDGSAVIGGRTFTPKP
ncbi:MAG: helix-turn-helix domain-containing protein [Verrucomicrobia bacterium]|nr:helix-turn-helix domain-containing protein [Verrucomicrobiota bacterium]